MHASAANHSSDNSEDATGSAAATVAAAAAAARGGGEEAAAAASAYHTTVAIITAFGFQLLFNTPPLAPGLLFELVSSTIVTPQASARPPMHPILHI